MLTQMSERDITPQCRHLVLKVRERLLRTSDALPLGKRELAIIQVMSELLTIRDDSRTNDNQPEERVTRERPSQITPAEEPEQGWEGTPSYSGLNGTHEYTGPRMDWNPAFKSTPATPVPKLERGRPITYVSERDGVRYPAKFVRMNKDDKTRCNIESSEMKKAFSIPIKSVEITDLSRPSTMPLAVQI